VQKLKPTIDAIKAQYGDDKKAIQRETTALYEASGVSPTAGGDAAKVATATHAQTELPALECASYRFQWRHRMLHRAGSASEQTIS
jgi:hypothetical protein